VVPGEVIVHQEV